MPDYGLLMARRVVLLAPPRLLVRAADSRPQTGGLAARPAFVLILAGEMIGRGVFYGLHMTVGMAVAS